MNHMNDTDKKPAVLLDQVIFRYQEKGKRNILDRVSLEIPSGSMTLIMGSSGCGKSTLAAVLSGLYPENGGYLESGTIELFGKPVSSMNQQERAGYLTLMFQNPDLQFCMDTLRKEMQFCLENLCVPPADMDSRISEAAQQLKICHLLDRNLHSLSGGEKQKAALACLYVMQSRCILLDECFANIDEDAAGEIVRMLSMIRSQGRTIIAIDHKADLWLDYADEIIILGEGGRVAGREICRNNLPAFRELFTKHGLYDPLGRRWPQGQQRRRDGEEILCLSDISIPKDPVRRRRFRRSETQELLLEHAEAHFYRGTMTAVTGPSGCGKTSTFLAVLKQHPYTGRIELDGREIAGMRPAELFKRIGIVFQNPANQFITQNVEEEVLESLKIWEPDLSEEKCRQRADELLESFQLGHFRKYSPYMLSQGQQRRLAVLSVLACGQQILLLDEPTYGQDASSTDAIMELLRKKTEEEDLTVIFITHDRALAAAWADHVYTVSEKKLRICHERT